MIGEINGRSELSGVLSPRSQNITGSLARKGRALSGVVEKALKTISYNDLVHKPTINGVSLEEGLFGRDLSLQTSLFGTTAEWNSKRGLISEAGVLYVYTDYRTYEVDNNAYEIAGFKLGDGQAYLIDLPFLSTLYDVHLADNDAHITSEEREFWNNKNRAYVNGEKLILTTE